jgi:hypothetical protein
MFSISDALPLQFWLVGKQTYNQERKAGIEFRPFYQLRNFEDEERVQYLGDTGYSLAIADCDGNELYRVAFVEASVGDVWEIATIPKDHCVIQEGMFIRFVIVTTASGSFSAFDFNASDFDVSTGVIARTDLVQMRASHWGTIQYKFTNKNSYAGLDYSEETTFQNRIFSKFADERAPETNEAEPIDNYTTVKLSSTTSVQKQIEVDGAPFYLHYKVKLGLQHNTVSIEDQLWEKTEEYSTTQINSRSPFYVGKSWLTKKEVDTFTNVYGVAPLT